ncbi:MAG: hypothetical protein VXZ45_04945 [Verrucomicrobiota bacterium]|nr:hypothetical protein [Verrucomicrobiota bacterium]
MNIIRIIKLPYVVIALSGFISTSLFGATKYINFSGNNIGGTGNSTNVYQASNWSGYSGGSPTNYTIDSDGNGQANPGDVIQLRVRGDAANPTSAAAPATTNAANYTLDAFNVGDFGEAYAKIASGHTMNTRNLGVGAVTNNSTVDGNGTLYVEGTANVSNAFISGQSAGATNTNGFIGTTIIRDGGVINAAKNAALGQMNANTAAPGTGVLTIETGGVFNHDSSVQTASTNGFVIGKNSGSTGTLNMNGGTANLYTFTAGDQNTANTGQTVNVNMNAGAINIEGWINGQADDTTVERHLTFDEGVIYLKDNWNGTQYTGKGGEITQLLVDYFGAGTGSLTLTTTVINGGLSDAGLITTLTNDYTGGAGSIEVDGGTIYYGRDNNVFGAIDDINGGGRYAIWAVPEPSAYSLIAGMLAMTAIMLRRRL